MRQLRIALTLPGAVSLGAYEAGAVAGLLTAALEVNARDPEALRIDALTGASAGSMTALLAARVLTAGRDPLPVLRDAWVGQPALHRLRDPTRRAPLSLAGTREFARGLFALDGVPRCGAAQSSPVVVDMALGCLRGFAYQIRRPALPEVPLEATSHLDWMRRRFAPGDPVEAFVGPPGEEGRSPLDVSLASGAHPAVFGPAHLDRGEAAEGYAAHGVTNLPAGGASLWFTDGGVIDNEPLGRCLSAANELDGHDGGAREAAQRLVLLIRPNPDVPHAAADPAWSGRERPRWLPSGLRALRMLMTHSLFEDLRRVEKTNSRLAWSERLAGVLCEVLSDDPVVRDRLAGLLTEIDSERRGLGSVTAAAPSSTRALVERLVRTATGLEHKTTVRVEVVSPALLDASGRAGLPGSIAGEFLGAFGGFLSLRARAHDFDAGLRSALAWASHPDRGLAACGLEPALAEAGCAAIAARLVKAQDQAPAALSFAALPRRAKLAAYGLGARIARLALKEVRRAARGR